MKRIVSLLLSLVLLCALFCSCAKKEEVKSVKIGIAAPNATHGWVAGVTYYAEKYCTEKQLDYKVNTSANAEEMAENLDVLLEWGADAIVLYPQWSGNEEAVGKVVEMGIPVVNFDFDLDCDGIYKITGNNYDMGYQSAKYIAEKVGDGASIAVLEVPSSGSVSDLRVKGFYDYLAEIGYDQSNIFTVSEDSFSRDNGYHDMTEVLGEYEKIDAVFSIDDEISIGVVRAIVEAGRDDIKAITGGGGMQEYFRMINDEEYASLGLASALYSPSMIGDAIDTAVSLANGESCEQNITIPTTIVTAENVGSYIDPENTIY